MIAILGKELALQLRRPSRSLKKSKTAQEAFRNFHEICKKFKKFPRIFKNFWVVEVIFEKYAEPYDFKKYSKSLQNSPNIGELTSS